MCPGLYLLWRDHQKMTLKCQKLFGTLREVQYRLSWSNLDLQIWRIFVFGLECSKLIRSLREVQQIPGNVELSTQEYHVSDITLCGTEGWFNIFSQVHRYLQVVRSVKLQPRVLSRATQANRSSDPASDVGGRDSMHHTTHCCHCQWIARGTSSSKIMDLPILGKFVCCQKEKSSYFLRLFLLFPSTCPRESQRLGLAYPNVIHLSDGCDWGSSRSRFFIRSRLHMTV
jgi:hypothetical protein